MRTLIIGGGGFVGAYLAKRLMMEEDAAATLTKLPQETLEVPGCSVYNLDILDKDAIQALLIRLRPEWIFHLAAQSSVAASWAAPQETVAVNIMGSLNVLDAVRGIPGYRPRILLIGSGEEYGAPREETGVLAETDCVHPQNPYAITKAAQNQFGALYASAYGMDIVLVRAFNHIGPGQSPRFVVADFCRQAAQIAAGQAPPEMQVGNLAAARDFTDVRDVVGAYVALAKHGKSGETYNVGSGRAITIQAILDEILRQCGASITVTQDPGRMRPVEVPRICADIQKLQADTGWAPAIPLEQTIADTLADWQKQLH